MNKKTKKNFRKIAPAALVGMLAVGGLGASAWLTTKDVDNHTQTITAGTFKMTLSGDTGFENAKAYPVSNAVGMDKSKDEDGVVEGTLTVANTGEVDQVVRLAIANADYQATEAQDGTSEYLAADKVHLYITDGAGAEVYNGTVAGAQGEKGFGTVKILNGGTDGVTNGSISYTIRMWIDEGAVNQDLYKFTTEDDGSITYGDAKSLQLKLEVLSVQSDGGITTDVKKEDGNTDASATDIDATAFEVIAGKASLTRTAAN